MEMKYTPSEQMKAYRGRNGLTQKQLGELLGIKQADVSLIENERRAATPEIEAALLALLERGAEPRPLGKAAEVLLSFLAAARQEMGRPMEPDEKAALSKAKPEELLAESVLTREALEVQASRELLSGAKAFRKKREAARNGDGCKC